MENNICLISLLVIPLGLSGCATVINGTSQDFQIASEPSGADVTLTGGVNCRTPCELSLKRKDDLRADFSLDGYKSQYVYIQSRTGGAGVGNILAGGIIGGVVDASNGASNSLYPRPLHVRLAADGSDDQAELVDKKGELISTVAAHNDNVRSDVEEALMKRGLMSQNQDQPEGDEAVSSDMSASDNTEIKQD